jgi:hypothetical protein
MQLEEASRPLIWFVTRLCRVDVAATKELTLLVNEVILVFKFWLVVSRELSWSFIFWYKFIVESR